MLKTAVLTPDVENLKVAADVILQGGLVAYPTETFYALGANGYDEVSIRKVFEVKGRETNKPLLLIIDHRDTLATIVREVPPQARMLMNAFWPGPLSLLFFPLETIPKLLSGHSGKIGVRVSGHPIARNLSRLAKVPLIATSANLAGRPEALNATEVLQQLGGNIEMILNGGNTPGGKGSTILDVTTSPFSLIREGAIPLEEIEKVVK